MTRARRARRSASPSSRDAPDQVHLVGKDSRGRLPGQRQDQVAEVSLAAIAVDGKANQPQLVKSLDVTTHPVATITLTGPVPLPAACSAGATLTRTAAATLTLNGITRPVTVTMSARRDGTAMEATGWLPVAFSDFRITGPAGYGFLGSLASDGTAEFLLILRSRQGSA
jgi:hypothetical protein